MSDNPSKTRTARTLTRNERLVLDALEASDAPLSAYAILDALRGAGLRAPMQVYRALDRLVADRLVHRLETLNAYIACCHAGRDAHHGAVVFAICGQCGDVAEWSDPEVDTRFCERARERAFTLDSAIVELRGLCERCGAE
ncbi:transcriptional repressor [Marivibrio halodurans]|uniref:Transcriptional repressor n=1 Tax=Marivibrio halodurans TaxID=2039722 RepID=A0A8J7S8C3_9PROT|nr:Fur family transcriptional regulator [Marivibrio halodurans]MBP5858744.1 transcriptional repressor [Marivibrio halodurans]